MKKVHHYIKNFIKTRKILSIISLLIIISIGYYIYSNYKSTNTDTLYIVDTVKIKDIVSTVTGTGQISASKQLDIKSKASGDIIYLNTKANGTEIKKGVLIAKIDTSDIEISLENAKISYMKLVKPADTSTLLQAENSLNDAVLNNRKSYDDALNTITNIYSELPTIINGLNDIFYSRTGYLQSENARIVGESALNLQIKAGITFDKAKKNYEDSLTQYKLLSRASGASTIESFVSDSYLLIKDIAEAIKNAQSAIDFIRNQKNDTSGDTPASNVASWTSTINSELTSITSAKTNILSSIQNLSQKTIDLADLKNGADELDIASQKLSLRQAQNNYDNYFIKAPFDGKLARLSVKSTDTVSSGTIIGTMVSAEKMASITLNEVDIAKVRVGQKVKLTFDAIDGLIADGTIATVDSIGTVTQGVVNYNVEITLDAIDERIKSGMSVSASIIVDNKATVLTVPNSAIKSQGKFNFVEVFNPPLVNTKSPAGIPSAIAPKQVKVEIGISNDLLTEIISGINENDQIVIRKTTGGATVTTPARSILNTGGSSVRIPRN